MERQYHQWFSPRLGFDLGLVSYGHYGTPLLAFPTSGGDEWEMEGQRMIRTLAPYIEEGRIKVFCVRSASDATFYNRGAHPYHRSWMQKQYDEYIRWEVVPFIHDHCKGLPPIAVMGASLGAYHAANSAFKHPDTFKWCFALSGVYDMRRFMDGMYDDNFYFNNPIDYLGAITDPGFYQQIATSHIHLATGHGPFERPEETYRFAEVLRRRNIPHHLDDWGPQGGHDWPYWHHMMWEYVGRHF
jgi:esterase/lipase superfamily enzyme